MLVFAGTVFVGCIARITFEKQQLTNALVGIDAAVGSRAVAEFQGEMSFPTSFCRGGIHDDSKPGIGALAQADHGDVFWHLHLFKRHA